jgi:ribosomal protein S18 acetylase RimI-like enzyme
MVTVRSAVPADADTIGRLQVETWRVAYRGLMPDEAIAAFDLEGRQRMWREGLARVPRPGSATFVAELDDEVVGFASVGRSRDEEAENEGELYEIYLLPSCWDRGIGRALLERGEESMREYGFERAICGCWRETNAASALSRRRLSVTAASLTRSRGTEVCELRYRKAL